MSKILEKLQQIVDEKQIQLDEILNSNQLINGVVAASPKDVSEVREALYRDELTYLIRLEMEEDRIRQNESKIVNNHRSEAEIIPPSKQDNPSNPLSLIEQMKARYDRKGRMPLEEMPKRDTIPGEISPYSCEQDEQCTKHPDCELPLGHDGNCKGERDYAT